MSNMQPPLWLRYGGAVLAVVLATLLRTLFAPVLDDQAPYLIYFGAIMFATWYGGRGPGVMVLVLGFLLANYLFVVPYGSLDGFNTLELVRLGLYVATGFMVVALTDSLHESRARAEASEREFRAMFQLAGSGNAQTDPATGRFLCVNHKLCMLTGYAEEELLQRTVLDITHPDDRAQEAAVLARVRAGEHGQWQSERRWVRKDGAVVWVLVTGGLIRGPKGRPPRMVATIQDITARVRAEEALRAREAQLQAIIDNSSAIVYAKDRTGRYILANRAYEQLLGLDRADILGKTDYELHPWGVAESFAENDGTALEADRPLEFEEAGVFADGVHTFLSIKFPLHGMDGTAYAVCGISADITGRKRAEEERERLLQQLAEADQRKDEFLATLAHELRNPLTPISNALQLIKRSAGKPDKVDSALAMAERQMDQLVRLVDDLLDVARIARGKIMLHKARVTVQAIAESALEIARPSIEAGGHRLAVELPVEPVCLEADLMRLAQAVSNLLINAAKYTTAGGRIRLAAHCDGQELVIAVQDTGIGIPPAQLARVFELFAQIEPATGRAHSGLGIGLALVKSLVELHGGRVAVTSAGPGQGSTFTLHLPLPAGRADGAETTDESPVPALPVPSSPRRVLVVDDDADVANSMGLLLETSGYQVRTAYDGTAALELARTWRPEVILLDIGMPDMDGLEVARQLRQAPALQGVRLIALTGWGQEADRRRSQAAGFDHYLVKPVDIKTLEALLRSEVASL